MDELIETAENILINYLKIPAGQKVLILREEENEIEKAFALAAKKNEIEFTIFQLNTPRKNSSPIPEALNEMKKYEYIISPTKHSTTHCEETTTVVKEGKKVITLPGITKEIFLKIKDADFEEIEKLNNKVIEFMKDKKIVHITTPSGTDIKIDITNREWIGNTDTSKGFVDNIPIGEAFVAPIETKANGIIYIDYFSTIIKPEDKAWIKIENGKIVDHSESASEYVELQNVPGGKTIAELGIGTNKAHKSSIGNILHDEKIYGTAHIAFGQNTSFGGVNNSDVHNDVILINPKIVADEEELKI
jgi:aminopeptidase